MSHDHEYATALRWRGSTATGYEAYDRAHDIALSPADVHMTVSADPAFRGSPDLTNPEQLLLAAASSCQLLSFLAIAARSGVDVVSYEDNATAVMPGDSRPMRITSITLRPRIAVAGDVDIDRVRRMVEKGHETCFIANSLTSDVTIEAEIEAVSRPR
jgi:organic hydroperoxide reductase OsmC/OhrA